MKKAVFKGNVMKKEKKIRWEMMINLDDTQGSYIATGCLSRKTTPSKKNPDGWVIKLFLYILCDWYLC